MKVLADNNTPITQIEIETSSWKINQALWDKATNGPRMLWLIYRKCCKTKFDIEKFHACLSDCSHVVFDVYDRCFCRSYRYDHAIEKLGYAYQKALTTSDAHEFLLDFVLKIGPSWGSSLLEIANFVRKHYPKAPKFEETNIFSTLCD